MSRDRTPLPDPQFAGEIYQDVTGKRLVAWLIDSVLIFGLTVLTLPFTLFLGLLFFPFLWLVVGIVYRVATLARSSATPGMRFVAIELRAEDGAAFDLPMATMHTLIYTGCLAIFPLQIISVGLMVAGTSSKGVPDHLLGTVGINRMVAY